MHDLTNATIGAMKAVLERVEAARQRLIDRECQLEDELHDVQQRLTVQRELAEHLTHAIRLLSPLGEGGTGPEQEEEETVELKAAPPRGDGLINAGVSPGYRARSRGGLKPNWQADVGD
jgi:hypothetical protein